MDYKLAKQLQDAGFEVKTQNQSYYRRPGEHKVTGTGFVNIVCSGHGVNECLTPDTCDTAEVPTLEELIEACGEGFEELVKMNVAWEAHGLTDNTHSGIESGGTPEEAVANLWLALNNKQHA